MSDEQLLAGYDMLLEEVKSHRDYLGRLEQEIQQRMTERGSTAIPSDIFKCDREQAVSYNQAALTPLKEIFTEGDLASCLVLAHEETIQVEDKWATVKVKSLARRYGVEAEKVVEQARVPGASRVKFERRGQ